MPAPDRLVLNIDIRGMNIMNQPLLKAHGIARINGKYEQIEVDTPILSVGEFVKVFLSLFKEAKQ